MSHHHHTSPLPPPSHGSHNHHPNNPQQTGDKFVAVTGKLSGPLGDADDNHVAIRLFASSGSGAGHYTVQFNVESTSSPHNAQYSIHDESFATGSLPPEGLDSNALVSYKALGLTEHNFHTISNGNLRTIVHSSLDKSVLVVAYGFTFPGNGIHMIHFNNGEKPTSPHANHPNNDGMLQVFYKDATGSMFRRSIFLKFQTQTL
jgi:hypothetical protein